MAHFIPGTGNLLFRTARRVVKSSRPRIRKTNKEYIEQPSPTGNALASVLNKWADKRIAKQEREALAKKHGVSFSD
jgi:hypothetical protein